MRQGAVPSKPQDSTDDDSTFDPVWYLQTYSDVRAAGVDPLTHYRQGGRAEGRLPAAMRALDLDHLLWRGHADEARPALEALLAAGPPPRERAMAGWALARWRADQGDTAGALKAILVFHDLPEGGQVLNHAGPWLLGVQLAVACGDRATAIRLLRAGLARFGPIPDTLLARFLCRKAAGAEAQELNDILAGIWEPQGLAPVEIVDLPGPRFDRLTVDPGPAGLPVPPGDQPLVSVIVPAFNAGATLATALRGLVAQSWHNLEILVIDDGSSDDTLAVARAWADRDARIRLLPSAGNRGAYAARNAGLSAAAGAFITVHDADDWSHPQKIERQALPLIADTGGNLMATVSHWVRAGEDLDVTRWRMEDRWIYRNVSSLMLRAVLRDALGYWDRVRVNADTEYYYRIQAAFGAASIHEVLPGVPLAFGRTSPDSLTMQSATHLRSQFRGARRDYMEAAHDWHERAVRPAGLHLPQFPACRPFRTPAALALAQPDPDPAATPFDTLSSSPLFDADWYALGHPDVLRADLGAVQHYLTSGARENRDCSPGFSTGGYRRAMGLDPKENPLLHYETRGRAMGAPPLPAFSGALAAEMKTRPCQLVFAHSSGKTLFGAERSLLDMIGQLASKGLAPVVVLPALQNPAYLDRILKSAAAVELIPQIWRHAGRKPHPQTVDLIRALIRKYRPQGIVVNTLVLDAPLAAARAEGVVSTVHVRELPAEDPALCRNLGSDAASLRNDLLAEADRFVVASQLVADWLDAPGRVEVRPNAVDPALFDLPFAPGPALRVAIVSSNIAKKGLADFLAVAQRVAEESSTIRFVIVGPPTLDLHLMQPLPANVDFTGYAETPVEAMAKADVVMSLSKFAESFGRTVMEAMAAGRPVVCYDRGAPPSLVESGVSGFVVPADHIESAALAILALDAARGQLAAFAAAARARAIALQAVAVG